MAHYAYERLSALDHSFLIIESPMTLMHVGVTAIFEPGPLCRDGRVDIDRIFAHIHSRLHKIPRYRQRLAYIPIERHPVWVDDERFNLLYHVRHTCLPRPGDERQLKRLAARINSQELDRGKPLWETWIVEGLAGGRFAMVSKAHHCMIDGVSGADLLSVLLSRGADTAVIDPPRWIPRPVPTPLTLLRDEAAVRLQAPWRLLTRAAQHPARVLGEVREGIAAVSEAVAATLHQASNTPFNQPVGCHRRFDWTATDIAAIRTIRERAGGSLNDVVLTVVAGAVGRFLQRRGVRPDNIDFRAFVPVSVRHAEDHVPGNRVASWIVDLPIAEPDPLKRLAHVIAATTRLKHSRTAHGVEILSEAVEWTGTTVLGAMTRLAVIARPFNLVVTNVPGPPMPLYLLGARMAEVYPLVPLALNQGLGLALFSYDGRVFWGCNADWDALPDLHDFVTDIDHAFAELSGRVEAMVRSKSPASPPSRKRSHTHRQPRAHAAGKRQTAAKGESHAPRTE
jgi:WS/DGAT/MGAT family acyltransferase